MVKAYLRYELTGSWGVIASSSCNICYDRRWAPCRRISSVPSSSAVVWNLSDLLVTSCTCGSNGFATARLY